MLQKCQIGSSRLPCSPRSRTWSYTKQAREWIQPDSLSPAIFLPMMPLPFQLLIFSDPSKGLCSSYLSLCRCSFCLNAAFSLVFTLLLAQAAIRALPAILPLPPACFSVIDPTCICIFDD